ncbi:MAG: putative secreted protein [Polyangiaceae bacterium]|jgi:uncharacterized membrane protein (UPF0127 family)|nr:putative secreted protein [Polyangiaceae bacterium]
MRSFLLPAVSILALGCACNRTEEPAAPTTAEGAPSVTTSASTAPLAPLAPVEPAAPSPTTSATPSAACTVPFGEPAPVVGKAATCPQDPTGNLKLPLGKVTFLGAPNAPQVEVELARDDAARERGLMYRTTMAENSGMLFSWEDERVRNFWMRNTCIPLDLLYIDKQGTIAGILEQVPTMNDAPRGVRCPVAHVLELNAGWARAHGLAPGMKIEIQE